MTNGGRVQDDVDVVDLTADADVRPLRATGEHPAHHPARHPDAHPDDRLPGTASRAARAALAVAVAGVLLAVGGLARTHPPPAPAGAAAAPWLAADEVYQRAADRALAEVAPGADLEWRLSSVHRRGSAQARPLELEQQSSVVTGLAAVPGSVRVLRLGYRITAGLPAGTDADPCSAPVMDVHAWPSDPAGRTHLPCTEQASADGLRWAVREVRERVPPDVDRRLDEPPPRGTVLIRSVTLVVGEWSCSVAASAVVRDRRSWEPPTAPVQPPLTTSQLQEVARALAWATA